LLEDRLLSFVADAEREALSSFELGLSAAGDTLLIEVFPGR
jgi:hypothetical protein